MFRHAIIKALLCGSVPILIYYLVGGLLWATNFIDSSLLTISAVSATIFFAATTIFLDNDAKNSKHYQNTIFISLWLTIVFGFTTFFYITLMWIYY